MSAAPALRAEETDPTADPNAPVREAPAPEAPAQAPPAQPPARTGSASAPVQQPPEPAPQAPEAAPGQPEAPVNPATGEPIKIEAKTVKPKALETKEGQIIPGAKGKKLLNINLNPENRDFTLMHLIELISKLTETNFILDPKLRGLNEPLQLLTPKPITEDEAWMVFETILDSRELVPVKTATGWYQIVEKRDAASSNIETQVEDPAGGFKRDVMVTRLVPLTYISASQIRPIVDKMKSKGGQVEVYDPTNTIILMDTGTNIERILKLLKELDVRDYDVLVELIKIKYSPVSDLFQLIQQLQSQDGSGGGAATGSTNRRIRRDPNQPNPADEQGPGLGVSSLKVIPDERTNSLLVVGTRSEMDRFKELVAKLDVPTDTPQEKIHVYYLEYADSEELASTLSSLVGSPMDFVARGQEDRTEAGGTATQRVRTAVRNISNTVNRAGGEGEAVEGQFEAEVTITPDAPTNALVISASQSDYNTLKKVISKLDIRRPQVNIEAMVLELGVRKNHEFGFEFRSISKDITEPGMTFFGGTNLAGGSGINAATGAGQAGAIPGAGALAIPGVIVGAADGTIQFGDVTFLNLAAFVRAIKTDNDINILSQPHLTTLDNEEAEIVVANNLPFRTGTSQTTVSTLSTIERKDVGLTLRITPQINESDYVRLKIEQEISQVVDSPTGLDVSDVGPTTSKRTANTSVVVKNNQTAVIGGLMSHDEVRTESKVPILGDIPVLGWLFRSSTMRDLKTNLLLFVTPHIMRDDMDTQTETLRYWREQAEIGKQYFGTSLRREEVGRRLEAQTQRIIDQIRIDEEKARQEAEVEEEDSTDPFGPASQPKLMTEEAPAASEPAAPAEEQAPEPPAGPQEDAPAP